MPKQSFPDTALLDQLRHWILITDPNFSLLYANPAAALSLGISKKN
jgi:PAS domain-containing protein